MAASMHKKDHLHTCTRQPRVLERFREVRRQWARRGVCQSAEEPSHAWGFGRRRVT